MQGELYIDNIDVYTTFGLSVVEQGYTDLIAWPALKAVPYNDWHEEDGIQPDLTAPQLDARTCTLRMWGHTSQSQADELLTVMSRSAHHTINAAAIGRTYTMRYVGCDNNEVVDGVRFMTLRLSEDTPTFVATTPNRTIAPCADFKLDGRNFTDYNARILEGTLSSITRLPDAKNNLSREIGNVTGTIYDEGVIRYKDYDVTLRVLMRAPSLSVLWTNYFALQNDFAKPGKHYISVAAVSRRYPCFYLSQKPTRFYASGKIWLEFEIRIKVFAKPEII